MTSHPTEMEDRVAIHALLMEYGAALDRHDFDGFGKLFGADGHYKILEEESAIGPDTGRMMRALYEAGDNYVEIPNFHMFYNEVIWFETPDKARSTSACMFMNTPDPATRKLNIQVAATYDDEIIREDGRWRFKRRTLAFPANGPVPEEQS